MKKIRILPLVLCLALLVGCGAGETKKDVYINPGAMFHGLLEQVQYATPLEDVGSAGASIFEDLPEYALVTLYSGSAYYADELIWITLASEADAAQALSSVEKHLAQAREQFLSYIPEEVDKIDHAQIWQQGANIIVCVTGDYQTAKKLMENPGLLSSYDGQTVIPTEENLQTTQPDTTAETTTQPPETTVPPTTELEPTEPPATEPQTVIYTLCFAGDCTLGTDHKSYGTAGSFVYTVGTNYSYPFENVQSYFANDDFTMVNLEGVFTEGGTPADKTFTFRGPESYAKILTAGSVEAVSLANNHTLDFGQSGYNSTKTALQRENVAYVEENKTALYTTQSGLTIGMVAAQFYIEPSTLQKAITQLRKDGAEIVIFSYHGGVEGSYRATDKQKYYAHYAIDAGADIVFGHHSHVLQPIEHYKNGVIYYSLGNFSFGGNRNPPDKDSAIIQQTVIRDPDGTVRLGETTPIACRLSSLANWNDFRPTPYTEGSKEQLRALSKLDGSFNGPDLEIDRTTTAPANTEPAPTEPEVTEPPSTEPPVVTTEAPVSTDPPVVTDPSSET